MDACGGARFDDGRFFIVRQALDHQVGFCPFKQVFKGGKARDGLLCGVFLIQRVVRFHDADDLAIWRVDRRVKHPPDMPVMHAHNPDFHVEISLFAMPNSATCAIRARCASKREKTPRR